MGKRRYGLEVKERVEQLRKAGKTYAEIRQRFPIPKSTLSSWLGEKYTGVFNKQAQLDHLKRVRVRALDTIRKNKIARDRLAAGKGDDVAHAVAINDTSVLKSLIAMLYWAEGTKSEKACALKFVNIDPRLAHLYITLLRHCYPIDEKRIRVRLHLHYYHKKKATVSYWSNLLNVPTSQFGKLYIKKRGRSRKFRKNFMGICFISYGDARLWKEVMTIGPALYQRIRAMDS